MKKNYRNLFIYLLVVIIPTIILSIFFINLRMKEDYTERVEHAKWIASIHETHWNQFISETVTSLEMLSLTAGTLINNVEQMGPLLQRAHQTDPRYGGLYLLDHHGHVMTGSNNLIKKNELEDDPYIKEVLKTKDTIISNNLASIKNGQQVIGLAVPVLNEENSIQSITVALLRVDYVQNIMNVLTPDTKLLVINANDDIIMGINKNHIGEINDRTWITVPIDRLPWTIKVKIKDLEFDKIFTDALIIILISLVLTNILYLLLKYMLLKRQAALEKQQNEAQKLELVGTLAASTAHEIRNPLTGIKGLVQLLSEKYKNPNDQFYFSVINDEIKRINEIVSEFLILGKPTVQKMEIIDLRTIILELQPLISSEANLFNVKWTCSMPKTAIHVACTKDQMKQVILNITKNAFESMSDGGNLDIELSVDKENCQLIITDTGTGIPDELLESIFNPFFTSKKTGTGLGLVVCKRILHSFNGKIEIKSKENVGTKVIISLPIVEILK
ncbi:ATP-binding protein [Cytobacillus sp. FJAT-54145]|uniref:histidine kinase n=1 Tax=Cytobacillus spartinae TaxID=3299023 RepID=A0ABW6KH88_9BACI